MTSFNKATAAVLAGAVVTIIGAFWQPDPTVLGAIQTLITAGLVYLVPNISKDA